MARSRKGKPGQRTPRSARQSAGTAERVLDAAYELFVHRRAFHETTIDDVARRARVAKGTVYLYHRSKEDLLFAAVEREMMRVQEHFLGPMRAAADPAQQLRALQDLDRWDDPRLGTLSEVLLVIAAHPVPAIRRRARALIRRASARGNAAFSELFAAAAGRRTWRGVRVEALALAYAVGLRGLVFQVREGFVESPKVAREAAAALARFLVPGGGS